MDKKNMFSLEGKIALITGGAHGIGFAIAESYAEAGATVVFNCSSEASLERGLTAYKEKGIDAHGYVCDVTDEEAVKKMIADIEEKIGTVDILVNNAGFGAFGEFYKTDLNNELNLIDLNIKAVHILTKLYLRDFREKNRGYILNTASLAGFCVGPLMSTYYASKAYVLRLTQSIKQELEQENSNVHICALCPGPVDTGFNKRAGVSFSMKPLTSDYVAKYAIRKMFQKKTVIVPGIVCKFSAVASKLLPSGIIGKVCYEIQKNKSK